MFSRMGLFCLLSWDYLWLRDSQSIVFRRRDYFVRELNIYYYTPVAEAGSRPGDRNRNSKKVLLGV